MPANHYSGEPHQPDRGDTRLDLTKNSFGNPDQPSTDYMRNLFASLSPQVDRPISMHGIALAVVPDSKLPHIVNVQCSPLFVSTNDYIGHTCLKNLQLDRKVDFTSTEEVMRCFIEVARIIQTTVGLQSTACKDAGIPFQKVALNIGDSSLLRIDPSAIALHLFGLPMFTFDSKVQSEDAVMALPNSGRDRAAIPSKYPLYNQLELNKVEAEVFRAAWAYSYNDQIFGLANISSSSSVDFLAHGLKVIENHISTEVSKSWVAPQGTSLNDFMARIKAIALFDIPLLQAPISRPNHGPTVLVPISTLDEAWEIMTRPDPSLPRRKYFESFPLTHYESLGLEDYVRQRGMALSGRADFTEAPDLNLLQELAKTSKDLADILPQCHFTKQQFIFGLTDKVGFAEARELAESRKKTTTAYKRSSEDEIVAKLRPAFERGDPEAFNQLRNLAFKRGREEGDHASHHKLIAAHNGNIDEVPSRAFFSWHTDFRLAFYAGIKTTYRGNTPWTPLLPSEPSGRQYAHPTADSARGILEAFLRMREPV